MKLLEYATSLQTLTPVLYGPYRGPCIHLLSSSQYHGWPGTIQPFRWLYHVLKLEPFGSVPQEPLEPGWSSYVKILKMPFFLGISQIPSIAHREISYKKIPLSYELRKQKVLKSFTSINFWYLVSYGRNLFAQSDAIIYFLPQPFEKAIASQFQTRLP